MKNSVANYSKQIVIITWIILGLTGCTKKSSEEYILSAQEFVQNSDFKAAIIELKSAVQADPQSASARFELGKVYLQINDFDSAEKELRRAMDLGHPSSDVVPLLSVAYQRTGAHNALIEVDHALESLSSAEQIEVGFYKLQSLIELDDIETARAMIEELKQIDTSSVYKGLVLTVEMILDEENVNALESAKSLRDQSPLNRDALMILARLYLSQQQVDEGLLVYIDYVSKFPEDTNTKFVLASMLTELGRTQEAEKYIDDLLELSPKNPMLSQLKGIVLAERGDFESASSFLKIALDGGRNDPVLRLVTGYAAYQVGDYELANSQLSLIAPQLPDDHAGLKLLAASQLQLGLTGDASSALARVETVTQDDAQLFSRTGFELLKAGNVKDARSIVERTKGVSDNAEDLLRLGVLQLSMNQIEGIINLEQAVTKAPESATAQTTLATAYLATNQIDKATALAEEWKVTSPDDLEPYLLEADIALRANDFAAADTAYRAALAISPADTRVLLAQSKMYAQQGKLDLSLGLINTILDEKPENSGALAMSYMVERERGDASAVVSKTAELLNADPKNEALRLILARMQATEEQFKQAIDTLSEINPDINTAKDYWLIKGQSLLRSNDLKGSENLYSEWLKLYPYDKDAALGILLIYDLTGQSSRALEVTKRFLSKRDDLHIALLESHFYSLEGDVEESREVLALVPETATDLPFLQGIVARNFITEGKFAEAMPSSLVAYQAKPNLRNLIMTLRSHEGAGENDAAFALLEQHAVESPDDTRVSMLLAERKIGRDTDSAIQDYQALIDENENNFVALNNLAYLYLQRGNLEQAEQLADKAVDLQPNNPATKDTLAQVFVAQKMYDKALSLYSDVITSTMQNEEIYLNYVETLLLAGNTVVGQQRANERTYRDAKSLATIQRLNEIYGIAVNIQ